MNGVHCQTSVDHHRGQREPADPVDCPSPNGQHPVDDAEHRIQHRGLPHQRPRHGCHQERRDQQRAHDAAAEELPVQQQRQQQPEHHRDQHRAHDHDHGVERDLPERAVLDHVDVVLQPDELARARPHQVPRQHRVVQREQERDLRDDDHEDQRRQQRPPQTPPLRPRNAGVMGLADQPGMLGCSAAARSSDEPGAMVVMTSPDSSDRRPRRTSGTAPAPRLTDFCPAIAALIC